MVLGRKKMAAAAAGLVAAAGISAGAIAATGGSNNEASDLATAINKRAGTNITAAQVSGAFQDLLRARLDQEVKAGHLTQAQADQILKRAQSSPEGLPGVFGGPGRGFHEGRGGPDRVLAAVATKLNTSEQKLHDQLETSGKTLAQLAADGGLSRAELLATIIAELKKGGVTAAQADAMAAGIADRADARGPGGDHEGPPPMGVAPSTTPPSPPTPTTP